MKRFIIWVMCIILVSLVGCQTTKAQTVKREGKTFITESSQKPADIQTSYMWRDSKGEEHPIILHQYTRGDKAGQWTAYVIKKSKKTGKKYKYYLPTGTKIATTIRKEMGL